MSSWGSVCQSCTAPLLEVLHLFKCFTLARNNHCEFWCGMHRTCKNTPIKPDRKWFTTRGEKQLEGILSTSLLDATYPSEPSRYLPWQIATAVQQKLQIDDMEVLGLSLFPSQKKNGRYVTVISRDIHMYCGRFVGPSHIVHGWSPCNLLFGTNQKPGNIPQKGFTSFQMVHTHTLPQEGGKVRPRPWNDNEEERKWKWDEDENEMKIT